MFGVLSAEPFLVAANLVSVGEEGQSHGDSGHGGDDGAGVVAVVGAAVAGGRLDAGELGCLAFVLHADRGSAWPALNGF